jgi:hypothetical protein
MIVNTTGEVVQSGGSSSVQEVILGSLDTFSQIGDYNQWIDIDSGKSFSDYDEICMVGTRTVSGGDRVLYFERIPILTLQKLGTAVFYSYFEDSYYIKFWLDYTNNKYKLENWNYSMPCALLGIKY